MEAKMEDFDTAHLNKGMEKTLKILGLQEVYYFSVISQHWDIIVGEPLSLKTAPKYLIDRVLAIAVEDAAYAHHLRYYANRILEHIASSAICGKKVAREIKFHVGKVKANRSVVFRKIRNNWKSIVNSPLAKSCFVEQLIDDRLIVAVPSLYYEDLRSIERDILLRINRKWSANYRIAKITYRKIKNAHAFRDGKIGRKEYRIALQQSARDMEQCNSKYRNLLDRIADPKLRGQFAKTVKSLLPLAVFTTL